MKCPYCNEELGQNSQDKFCLICGHRLVRCSTCGEILTKKIKFCPKDGTKIPDELFEQLPDAVANANSSGVVKKTAVRPAVKAAAGVAATGAAVKKTNNTPTAEKKASQPEKKTAKPVKKTTQPEKKPVQSQKQSASVKEQKKTTSEKVPKKDGKNPILLVILAILLVAALVLGGYFAANALLSGGSTAKESASRNDRDGEDDDDKRDDGDDADDKDAEKDKRDRDSSSSSSSVASEEKEKDDKDAVAYTAEEEEEDSEKTDSKKTESEEKESDKKTEDKNSGGVSFSPEKQDPSEITASVATASSSAYSGLTKVKITKSESSSVVSDNKNINNEASQMVDGDEITSWQEGADGDGIGEWTQFTFKKEYNVKCITFKMGNWRDQDRYLKNNRPQSVLLRLGGQEFNLTFPDGKNEYMVEFSDSLPASDIYLEILSVYKGNEWDDTCISEMTVYKE